MIWTWDPDKNFVNQDKHRVSFETAQLVFDDPLALMRPDPYPYESRWQTVGTVNMVTLLVVDTRLDSDSDLQGGRIISARRATRVERRAYEEGDF
ncbi:MAG: BrnT family toxin [Chloroflexi bacterium]|nr:BrnT family toxin [Chloroflexota bacterium]MYD47709.1 BrnT family toxin [Chloroflexota bacterium]